MKSISFKAFKQFKEMKVEQDGKTILFYSRLYGNRDWGFSIHGLYAFDLGEGEKDYIQVQFLTGDIEILADSSQVIGNRERKVMTLKGITAKNYKMACEWIESQRKMLLEGVTELKGEYNPLIDLTLRTEILDQKVVSND